MKCKAKTNSGEPCKAQALQTGRYCFTHDPASGAARALAHKKGGKRNRTAHGGQAEALPATVTNISEAMKILDYALAEIIPMENSIARGRLLIALAAGYVDSLRVGEIENRLAAIDAILKARPNESSSH
jgi:hypothetical protein